MARNYEAIYTHWSELDKVHTHTPKNTIIFVTLIF